MSTWIDGKYWVAIVGGAIDGTPIGATTPAAGSFTTLTASAGGSLTGTWTNLGAVTTVDINGGTIDGVVVGASNFRLRVEGTGASVPAGAAGAGFEMWGSESGVASILAYNRTTLGRIAMALDAASYAIKVNGAEVLGLAGTGATVTGALTATLDVGLVGAKKLYFDGVARTGDTYITESSANVLDLYAGGAKQLSLTATTATVAGTLTAAGAFGCNTKAAQTAYASGGALAAYGTGLFGFDSEAHASALYAMVVSIRAALVANGVMS